MNHPFVKALVYFVLSLLFVLAAVFLSSLISNKKEVDLRTSVIECPSDFASYEKLEKTKSIILLQDVDSHGEGTFVDQHEISLKRSGLKSQIACGYLFYSVNVGENPINQDYMNFYMIPTQGKQFGGHILPDRTNTIINEDIDGRTRVLLLLSDITYDGTERKNIQRADWVSLLNVSDRIDFTIALNTADPNGHINLVKIVYKCWNPETGEETSDCKLEVIK